MKRFLAGLATLTAIAAIVAVSVGLFRGSFTKTVPVTVISDRAGLVMNPEAKVKLNGAQVGKEQNIRGHRTHPEGGGACILFQPRALAAQAHSQPLGLSSRRQVAIDALGFGRAAGHRADQNRRG